MIDQRTAVVPDRRDNCDDGMWCGVVVGVVWCGVVSYGCVRGDGGVVCLGVG